MESAIEEGYIETTFTIREPKRNDSRSQSSANVGKEKDRETGDVLKGIILWSDIGEDGRFGQNMVTLLYLWANPEVELEEAQTLAQDLLVRFEEQPRDLVEPYGDCAFVLSHMTGDYFSLKVHTKEDQQGYVKKSLYQPVDYQEACDPSPYQEHQYWLEGTVLTVEKNEYLFQDVYYTFQATDGHVYQLSNSYVIHPYLLEEGKAYRIYGNLFNNSATDLPRISINRWEPLDTEA